MKEFFFDTADINFINETWEKVKARIDSNKQNVRGITTNPNAFNKIGKHTLKEWLKLLPKLCETVTNIRGDDDGIVYIQCPYDHMSQDEVRFYADLILKHTDKHTSIGLKIPPYTHLLEIATSLPLPNVTGIADYGTALKCLLYDVSYISIIPGRMEEVGINAHEQLLFLQDIPRVFQTEIITGSMRTIQGLEDAFNLGTIPTIGEKVWNLLLESYQFKFTPEHFTYKSQYSPAVSHINTELSFSFFEQMNKMGAEAYKDFRSVFEFYN